ncbi:hypothetical protein J2Z66_007388 [Paenibacillus eucommiae]|uniref:Uncharacterized protein n=1 Tax=Paenibacillus eucommiae TaxID=1355755 RepID=A0ABS4J905_9BACL|nr:hypothetical protein [Paenibacillus eucommiae]
MRTIDPGKWTWRKDGEDGENRKDPEGPGKTEKD